MNFRYDARGISDDQEVFGFDMDGWGISDLNDRFGCLKRITLRLCGDRGRM